MDGVEDGRDELQERFSAFLAAKLKCSGELRLIHFDRRVEGWSWETYVIDVEWVEGSEARRRGFVVKRAPVAGLLLDYDVPAHWKRHQAVLEASAGTVPLPRLLWMEPSGDVAGRPFYVMEKVEGVVPVPWRAKSFFRSDDSRHEVGRQLARLAANLHRVPIDRLADALGVVDTEEIGRNEARYWESVYEAGRLVRYPLLEEAFAWLERRADYVSGRVAVVHGDFRIGNFMMRDENIIALLDWERVRLGDPIADIATCALPFYRGHSPEVSQLLEYDEFVAIYEAAAGWDVPPRSFQYWTVHILAQAAVTHVSATRLFEEGRTNDLRYANMGHQIHHVLKWLARALELDGTGARI